MWYYVSEYNSWRLTKTLTTNKLWINRRLRWKMPSLCEHLQCTYVWMHVLEGLINYIFLIGGHRSQRFSPLMNSLNLYQSCLDMLLLQIWFGIRSKKPLNKIPFIDKQHFCSILKLSGILSCNLCFLDIDRGHPAREGNFSK